MRHEVEELEQLLELINWIKLCFIWQPTSWEEEAYYHEESKIRRVFDVISLILAGKDHPYRLPPLGDHYKEYYEHPERADAFHRSLLKNELEKYGWRLEITQMEKGWKLEEMAESFREIMIETIDHIPSNICFFYDMFDEFYCATGDMLCITLENRELAHRCEALDVQKRKEICGYLKYMAEIHDHAASVGLEMSREAIRLCLIIPPQYNAYGYCYESLNMCYCTPEVILAARIIAQLCNR